MIALGSSAVGKGENNFQAGGSPEHPKSAPVHLICACNSSFIMPLSVMLTSVVDHFNPERALIVHIISNDATSADKDNVRRSIDGVRPGLKNIELCWYSLTDEWLNQLPDMKGRLFSRDAFARLAAPYLLGEQADRAVYLDCDMVVLADIAELYDSTDDDYLLHAAPDLFCPLVSSRYGVIDYAERGIPADHAYFNSGTLVINLKRWRQLDLTPPLIEYLSQHDDWAPFADQSIMNALLYNDWAPLDPRWNQQSPILTKEARLICGYSKDEWRRLKNDPFIVHYSGYFKPWGERRRHSPRRIHFFRSLAKTVFKNTVPRYPYLESILGTRAYYHLWKLATKILPGGFRQQPEDQK